MAEALLGPVNGLLLREHGRDPLPPFSRNVYIGHSFDDSIAVQKLCQKLQERGIKCYPRYMKGDNTVKERIDEGMALSEKCLLLMTENYQKNTYKQYELQKVEEKAKGFSSDLILVLWFRQPQMDGFSQYRNEDVDMDLESFCLNEESLESLTHSILSVPLAKLSCLPKENIGYGAATGFFYGFLRLVLPGFRERCFNAVRDYQVGTGTNMINRTVPKMMIVLPISCFAPPTMKKDGIIEVVDNLYVICHANRAGNVARDYKSTMYKLIDQNEFYYFAGELATPLLTMYESYYFGLTGLTRDQLYRERDAFCYTLHQILQHPENRECNGQFRLLMWDDRPDLDDNPQQPLDQLLLSVLKEELQREEQLRIGGSSADSSTRLLESTEAAMERQRARAAIDEALQGIAGDGGIPYNNVSKMHNETTYEKVSSSHTNLAAFWERRQFACYRMRKTGTRGKALIINIKDFDQNQPLLPNLTTRKGSERDEDKMKKLFEDAGFETTLYRNCNRDNFERVLMIYGNLDHSTSDAFLCCIMTHGHLGKVYCSDGRSYRILDIVDLFSARNCPSLRGKPKLFFVQSCQRGETDSDRNGGGVLERDRHRLQTDDGTEVSSSETLEKDADVDQTDTSRKEQITPAPPTPSTASTTPEGASGASSETMLPTPATPTINLGGTSNVSTAVPASPESASGASNGVLLPGGASGGSSIASSRQSSWEKLSMEEKALLVPGEPDILMSYSALPGTISYRDPNRGSLYIDALVTNLSKDMEIDRALKQVTEYVTKRLEQHEVDHRENYKQFPFHLTTGMSKLLYLTPIKRDEEVE